uniref:DDE-1 domain-containing protein n=1 Tax=Globodera rostochiensis TaxID=31243 RepID=A0A914HUQ6_GLORO
MARLFYETAQFYFAQTNFSGAKTTRLDNELTTKYLEEVFGNFFFGNRLLKWDSFRCHISADTKQTLQRLAIHTAVIPGGTTKYIQKDGAIPNGLALLQQRRQEEDMTKLVEEIDLNEDDNLGSDYSIEL